MLEGRGHGDVHSLALGHLGFDVRRTQGTRPTGIMASTPNPGTEITATASRPGNGTNSRSPEGRKVPPRGALSSSNATVPVISTRSRSMIVNALSDRHMTTPQRPSGLISLVSGFTAKPSAWGKADELDGAKRVRNVDDRFTAVATGVFHQ